MAWYTASSFRPTISDTVVALLPTRWQNSTACSLRLSVGSEVSGSRVHYKGGWEVELGWPESRQQSHAYVYVCMCYVNSVPERWFQKEQHGALHGPAVVPEKSVCNVQV